MKWLKALYHSLTAASAGETIAKLKNTAEADYRVALAKVEETFAKDLAALSALGHRELDALEHMVAVAQARIADLLASEVDLGHRNGDAAALHRDLSKAVK